MKIVLIMPTSCVTCPYRETGCLEQQLDEAVSNLSNLLTRYSIRGKGKTIYNQGELTSGIYFLCNGLIKLARVTDQGEETIVDIVSPCSVIGGINVVGENSLRIASAITVTELTEVAHLKREDLVRVLQAYPTLGIGLSRHLSARLGVAYRLIADMKLPVEDRVLALIARIMILLIGKCENIFVEIPFSHRELAQFAQITPETLSRTLHTLQDKGIIGVEKKGLRVLQAEELRKYVDEAS